MSMEILGKAARARTFVCERWDVEDRCDPTMLAEEILLALPGSKIERWALENPDWASWAINPYAKSLTKITIELKEKGIDLTAWCRALRAKKSTEEDFRKSMQKEMYKTILLKDDWNAEHRIRQKIARWKLNDVPRQVSCRILHNLRTASKSVAPCVSAGCISTICNRWTTERRFQRRHLASNKCVFFCPARDDGQGPEDSLEHYFSCPCLARIVGTEGAQLHNHTTKQVLLLCGSFTKEERIIAATTTYAIYSLYNFAKHNPNSLTCTLDCIQFAKQILREHASFPTQRSTNALMKIFKPPDDMPAHPPPAPRH